MKQKKIINIFTVIIIIFLAIFIYSVIFKKIFKITPVKNEISIPIQTNSQVSSIKYNNTQYSFSFTLPISWSGYAILIKNWEGNTIDEQPNKNIKGPEILIRHPLWTSTNPRQDIPIMIFTPTQWDLIKQEKLSLGAAPIGPSELGRNNNYIFALPARYNFAYLIGFEEVEEIIKNNSLHAF